MLALRRSGGGSCGPQSGWGFSCRRRLDTRGRKQPGRRAGDRRTDVCAFGGVDILVNNAASGRIYPGGSLTVPDSGWQDDFNTNFFWAVRLTAALLPGMLERKSGAIVNISSGATLTPLRGAMIHYSSAKAAMSAWSRTLATEVPLHGVRVNAVTPGNIATLGADVVRADFTKAFGTTRRPFAAIPLRRMGVPQDLAEIVGFLISDRAAWITGTNFIVDGGQNPAV
jgi:NAD(P)-dependent dehydrogenase (short-subunit alcohol dehydrogenase family)